MSDRKKGRIKWFNVTKGFGFIEVDEGKDIFVHASQVDEDLKEGDPVEFSIIDGKKGPMASDVKKDS